ncbi:hypothetical protein [Vagococcus fessus]|uniref:DUF4179 domain-containing protein n=1 Tax=Vagococcus fessus TaxID=120370 RepID=A0A430AC27_9ENTE|nr:hypothetical protein [Vagococcus fessus]RSU04763.1 hypothetical protein CBF31_01720 [Vagococcus fessus]
MDKNYKKEPLEHLTDEQLDDFLNYLEMPFREIEQKELTQKIKVKQSEEKKVMPFKKKKATIIATAAASVLLLSAFSQRDNIKIAYMKSFGTESQKLLLKSDKLNDEVVDNGLKLKAKTSFKDENRTYFVSELTDLKEDRLAKDTRIQRWEMLSGGNTQVVDYNPKTKTATLVTRAITMEDTTKLLGFKLNSFISHEEKFDEIYKGDLEKLMPKEAKWIDNTNSGGGANDVELDKLGLDWDELDKRVLKPGVINEVVSTKQDIILENMALEDGLLHMLIKRPNDVNHDGFDLIVKSKQDGVALGYVASFQVDEGTHNNESGRTDYEHFIFNIGDKDLKDYSLELTGSIMKDYVKGNWAIKLAEPTYLVSKELEDLSLKEEGIELKNVSLSPLGLSFDYTLDKRLDKTIKTDIELKNGTHKEVSFEPSDMTKKSDHFMSELTYFELEDVASVTIAGKTVPFK